MNFGIFCLQNLPDTNQQLYIRSNIPCVRPSENRFSCNFNNQTTNVCLLKMSELMSRALLERNVWRDLSCWAIATAAISWLSHLQCTTVLIVPNRRHLSSFCKFQGPILTSGQFKSHLSASIKRERQNHFITADRRSTSTKFLSSHLHPQCQRRMDLRGLEVTRAAWRPGSLGDLGLNLAYSSIFAKSMAK